MVVIAGCSLEKKSGFNRSMQNLTAHYNILFNAKEILRLKQDSYATSFVDNYNEILSVYQDTTPTTATPDKDLEAAVAKANNIINIKEQSHYIGDAYLVLGKANYLEGNYFNAVEYFSYVIRSFPKRKDLWQEALVWKARTLIYLEQLPKAKAVIDTALDSINVKKRPPADIYATKLKYDVAVMDYTDGEQMALQAVKYCKDKTLHLRWTFILAQLQEMNGKQADAMKNYTQIAKSNAQFEMAFNASLNLIRIEDSENGIKINRIARLMSLLKNPNNKEFKDQIYYQVAQLQMADKKIDDAIKNYNLSVRATVKNQSQKGLSYLRLAEIYFNNKADYIKAKKYYDSTLTSLPANFQGYQAIQKKSANLALLADRLQIISREDTLQALAKMDEKKRDAVIDKMVSDYTTQQAAQASAAKASGAAGGGVAGTNSFSGGAFYFDNSGAVSQGYTDFKRVWGNRKLEDDWRRSSRSSSNVTANSSNSTQGNDPDGPINKTQNGKSTSVASGYRKDLIQSLPLTPALLAQSNLRVYNAYVDIANFYRDVLDEKKESIRYYELVLKRFPDDPNKPAVYYSLYRLYTDVDMAKSDFYKNKLLKDFPETPFAKIITDPDFVKKLEDKDVEFTQAYNVIFDLYAHKEYKEVVACIPELMKLYPGNKLSAQLYYLQTISQGHFEKAGPFRDSLNQLVKQYPLDRLVTPLAKQHLAFIEANKAEIEARPTVLADVDPHDVPFTLAPENQKIATYRHPPRPPGKFADVPAQRVTDKAKPKETQLPAQPGKTAPGTVAPPIVKHPVLNSIYNLHDSTNYYFVINVGTGTTNLSSSRFGVGQFNRANFTGQGLKHQVMPAGDDNQLIFVGSFKSLDDVKKYARTIVPVLADIMKVPVDKYSYFIITRENLLKVKDKKTLDSYIDFYQNSY